VQKDTQVVAVVINWQRPQDTIRCLGALRRSRFPSLSIAVVDNASDEAGAVAIAAADSQATILRQGENRGFAAGANAGVRHALAKGAGAVWLVNDDIEVEPDTLDHLHAAIANEDVAAAGGKVLVAGRRGLIWSAGERDPRRQPLPDDGSFDHDRDVLYATGCCLLLKASALAEVGLFDEAYFALFEEVDWCARARAAGLRIRYAWRALAHHHIESSLSSGASTSYHYLNTRNWLRFAESQRPRTGLAGRLAAIPPIWWHEVKYVLRHGSGKLGRIAAVSRGALDYLRSRMGPPDAKLRRGSSASGGACRRA
jgi:GT2 family glycosyltransferase